MAIALVIQVVDTRAGWQKIRNQLMAKPATEWATPLQDPFWVRAASRYRKVRWMPPMGSLLWKHWRTFAAYAGRHGLGTDAVPLARVEPGVRETARKNALAILDTGRYASDSLYVLDPTILSSAALHIDPETDLLARIDGFYLVAPGWKRCHECGHLDSELEAEAILPVVGIGERIQFSQAGAGAAYLATGWANPEAWGTWSNGREAAIVLPLADDGVHEVLIEADALVSPAHPRQDLKIAVNGILAATTSLTAATANRIRIPIPEASRERLQEYRTLRLDFRFPDAVPPRGLRIDDDPRSRALGLVAITLM